LLKFPSLIKRWCIARRHDAVQIQCEKIEDKSHGLESGSRIKSISPAAVVELASIRTTLNRIGSRIVIGHLYLWDLCKLLRLYMRLYIAAKAYYSSRHNKLLKTVHCHIIVKYLDLSNERITNCNWYSHERNKDNINYSFSLSGNDYKYDCDFNEVFINHFVRDWRNR